jgi:hypothetical protein
MVVHVGFDVGRLRRRRCRRRLLGVVRLAGAAGGEGDEENPYEEHKEGTMPHKAPHGRIVSLPQRPVNGYGAVVQHVCRR